MHVFSGDLEAMLTLPPNNSGHMICSPQSFKNQYSMSFHSSPLESYGQSNSPILFLPFCLTSAYNPSILVLYVFSFETVFYVGRFSLVFDVGRFSLVFVVGRFSMVFYVGSACALNAKMFNECRNKENGYHTKCAIQRLFSKR